MKRRTFLLGAAVDVAVLAGCLGKSAPSESSGTRSSGSSSASSTSSTTTTSAGSAMENSPTPMKIYSIDGYNVENNGSTASPLRFDSELINNQISPNKSADFTIEVTNTGNKIVHLSSSPPSPFGTLDAVPQKFEDNQYSKPANARAIPIWEAKGGVDRKTDGSIIAVASTPVTTRVTPSQTISRRFQIRSTAKHLRTGKYVIINELRYMTTLGNESTSDGLFSNENGGKSVKFVIQFQIESE